MDNSNPLIDYIQKLQQGDEKSANHLFHQLKDRPNIISELQSLSEVLLNQENYYLASLILSKGIELSTSMENRIYFLRLRSVAYNGVSEQSWKDKQLEFSEDFSFKALNDSENLILLDSNNVLDHVIKAESLLQIATVRYTAEKFDDILIFVEKAHESCKHALSMNPSLGRANQTMGNIHCLYQNYFNLVQQKDSDVFLHSKEVVKFLTKAIFLGCSDIRDFYNRGVSISHILRYNLENQIKYKDLNSCDLALKDFMHVISLDNTHIDAMDAISKLYLIKHRIHKNIKQFNEAIESINNAIIFSQKILELSNNHVQAIFNISNALSDYGKHMVDIDKKQEALEYFLQSMIGYSKVYNLDRNNLENLYNKGICESKISEIYKFYGEKK